MDKKRVINAEASVTMSPDQMDLVKKLKVGGKVRLVLYGSLTALNLSADENSEMGGPNGGDLTMTVTNMKVASNNDIAELFDEDLDG